MTTEAVKKAKCTIAISELDTKLSHVLGRLRDLGLADSELFEQLPKSLKLKMQISLYLQLMKHIVFLSGGTISGLNTDAFGL